MSNWQTIWRILWGRAARDPLPFEIAEVVPAVARELGVADREAEREISVLLSELERLPDGERFFRREGNAVVALPGFADALKGDRAAIDAYPFEL